MVTVTDDRMGEAGSFDAQAELRGRLREIKRHRYCVRPVLLRGATCDSGGEVIWSTAAEPDGLWRKPCGNRREALCAPCAEVYRQDAFQLVSSGLRGGKGVPETVAGHPLLFVTLTAPSFGPVHTCAAGTDGGPRRCRPRRDDPRCVHGQPLSCGVAHDESDPRVGEPLCRDCFDYSGAVMWNNLIGELWRRTTIYLPRQLAQLTGVTQKRLREQVRVSYVKVAEYQRRGLVHLHVVVRLDRAMPAYRRDEVRPPRAQFTTDLLDQAVRATVSTVAAPAPEEIGGGTVMWGQQLDVQHIGAGAMDAGHCAGYLAKYATKATEQAGGVLHRVSQNDVEDLPVREHVREFIREAFGLAGIVGPERRLAATAHTFGVRGHTLSKSRRYSTTFKALRAAREQHREAERIARLAAGGSQHASLDQPFAERFAAFEFKGVAPLTALERRFAEREWLKERERRKRATREPGIGSSGTERRQEVGQCR
jgi:hypothetical protein